MNRRPKEPFFPPLRQKLFETVLEREIYDRILPHLNGEKDNGYCFGNDTEMDAETEKLDAVEVLVSVEFKIKLMPDSYGRAFRHILHRDIRRRLAMYDQLARRRIRRMCDPRFMATRLKTAE